MAKQTFTTGQVLTAAQMTSLQQTAMLGGSASAKTDSYTLVAADAGTAVTMNKTTGTTITVNTGLFAAGDTVTILNIGAGTCTITAGTATVSKPNSATLALVQNAGGVLYFTATGAAIFLPFATGAGALTLITRNTFSNVATVDLDDIFTSAYETYLVIGEELSAASALDDPHMQVRYAGGNTITTGYYNAGNTCTFTGTAGTLNSNNLAHWLLYSETGSATYPTSFSFTFNHVGQTGEAPNYQGTLWSEYNSVHTSQSGYVFQTAQTITGLRFKSSSSNISGVISVYGYAKA